MILISEIFAEIEQDILPTQRCKKTKIGRLYHLRCIGMYGA